MEALEPIHPELDRQTDPRCPRAALGLRKLVSRSSEDVASFYASFEKLRLRENDDDDTEWRRPEPRALRIDWASC